MATDAWFGVDVTRIGDLDGDGVDDIVIGSIGNPDGGPYTGAVYIIFLNRRVHIPLYITHTILILLHYTHHTNPFTLHTPY